MQSTKKILLISALPLSHSAGLGQDIVNALTQEGYHVDVLTKHRYEGQPKFVSNVLGFPFKQEFLKRLRKNNTIMKFIWKIKKLKNPSSGNYESDENFINFTYPDELRPAVSPSMLTSKIKGEYAAVITLFWQYFLTTESLKAVYDKLKCPIIIYSVDMAPMTGGCHYFGKCTRLFEECGLCPALHSKEIKDASHRNFCTKKSNYSQINHVYLANTWMNQFARKTGIFLQNRIRYASIVLDQNRFSPAMTNSDKFQFAKTDQFIIMFRSSIANARKGDLYVEKIIKEIYDRLTPDQREKVTLMSVGSLLSPERKNALKFDIKDLGVVSEKDLIKAYRSSSIYISSSIDDAGPSMLNQAMMCGTPVAAFNIGTAMDLIQHNENGFKASVGEITPLVDGIYRLINEPAYQRQLSKNARITALEHNSYSSFSKTITSLINEFS